MKAQVLNAEGKETKTIDLPKCFSSRIREDVTQKYFEAEKRQQPYAPNILAGKLHSASGKIRHQRHRWKTAYGRGISRVPRKIFWRRGTQFYWQGASINSAVGGRAAHPPRVEHFLKKKKINKKEKLIAIQSALSSTGSFDWIKKRYETLKDIKTDVPYVVSSEVLKMKTKELLNLLKKILGENYSLALKGKRKAGLLLVIGKGEEKKVSGIDVRKVSDLVISDLYPLGRLTIYTAESLKDLEKLWIKEEELEK